MPRIVDGVSTVALERPRRDRKVLSLVSHGSGRANAQPILVVGKGWTVLKTRLMVSGDTRKEGGWIGLYCALCVVL